MKRKMKAAAEEIGGSTPAPPDGPQGLSKPCPICGKPAVIEMRPFCSKRCADVDLHRWLGGTYAIPAEDSVSPDDREDEP